MCTDVIRLKVFWGEGATTEKGKTKCYYNLTDIWDFTCIKWELIDD